LGAGSRQFESGRPDHTLVTAGLNDLVVCMSALYAATLKAFKARGWHYREVTGREVVETDFEAHHAKIPLHVQVFGDAHMASVVSRALLPFPGTHRGKVAELLMRTNQQLTLGNFEMDWDAGEVYFRVTNIFPAHRYDESVLAAMVHAAVAEMDRLTPYLGEVCRTPSGELLLLKVTELMAREDLLPPVPE
jgi:hypothetical protein